MGYLIGIVMAFLAGIFSVNIGVILSFIIMVIGGVVIMFAYQKDLMKRFGAETNNREYESRKKSSSSIGTGMALFCMILGIVLRVMISK